MSNELVLVTGATGFLAPHVIKILLKNGYRVRGSVRNLKDETKIRPLKELGDQLELVQADLMEPESWIKYEQSYSLILSCFVTFFTLRVVLC